MNSFANLASKKFGIMILVVGSLLTNALQQPEKAMQYMLLACGMSVVYSGLEILDKWLEKKNSSESK